MNYGDLQEISNLLYSSLEKDKINGMKQLINFIGKGENCSSITPHIINMLAKDELPDNILFKRFSNIIIDMYIVEHPDYIKSAVKTIIKDYKNIDPLIRGLAIKRIGSVINNKVAPKLIPLVISAAESDDDYLRKTAATTILKLFQNSPILLNKYNLYNVLQILVLDENPNVAINALNAVSEINSSRGMKIINIPNDSLLNLLSKIEQANEWGQARIIDFINDNITPSAEEANNIIQMISTRLLQLNSGITMSAVRCCLKMSTFIEDQEIFNGILTKISYPLLFLSSNNYGIQYSVLKSITIFLQHSKSSILMDNAFNFFVRKEDPLCIKLEKLDILFLLTNQKNLQTIVSEFINYSKGEFNTHCCIIPPMVREEPSLLSDTENTKDGEKNNDSDTLYVKKVVIENDVEDIEDLEKKFQRKSIQLVSRLAINFEQILTSCIETLVLVMQRSYDSAKLEISKNDALAGISYGLVVGECIASAATLLRFYNSFSESKENSTEKSSNNSSSQTLLQSSETLIPALISCGNVARGERGRSSLAWLIGEYANSGIINNPAEMIDNLFASGFIDEGPLTQLAVLSATVKIYIIKPDEGVNVLRGVLALSLGECDDPDVQERARIYGRILSECGPQEAQILLQALTNTNNNNLRNDSNIINSENNNIINETLNNELVPLLGTLASLYRLRPSEFVPILRISSNNKQLESSALINETLNLTNILSNSNIEISPKSTTQIINHPKMLQETIVPQQFQVQNESPRGSIAIDQELSSSSSENPEEEDNQLNNEDTISSEVKNIKNLLLLQKARASNSFIEIFGGFFVLQSGQQVLVLKITNYGTQTVNINKVHIRKNLFSLSLQKKIKPFQIDPDQSSEAIGFPIISKKSSKSEVQDTEFVKLNITYNTKKKFKITCPLCLKLILKMANEGGKITKAEFMELYQTIPESCSLTDTLDHVNYDSIESIKTLLEKNRIYFFAKRGPEYFFSIMTTNNKRGIAIIELLENQRCDVTVKLNDIAEGNLLSILLAQLLVSSCL